MVGRRIRVLGLLTLLSAVAACTQTSTQPRSSRADVAVPSYTASPAAPLFCARLADSTHLTDLPSAMGRLATDPHDVEAKLTLTAAIVELGAVREDGVEPEYRGLNAAVEDLVAALVDARRGPLTDPVLAAVTDGLDEVGARMQPLCEFPS